ncbi:MAG: hypothetical protein IT245_09020 [Bacteroidia bacterium]|nr:hypothetical protein [Bacteroidia bacterium]
MPKNEKNFQSLWNEILTAHAPSNISLAREISELLDISQDSAYRRLRNETDYTLDEAAKIANHFNLPLEALNNGLHATVSFKTNTLSNQQESYHLYLENMLANLKKVNQFETAEIFFGAEDIPVFYHYSCPILMKFKIIYWLKSLLLVPEFQNKNFEEIEINNEMVILAEEIFKTYSKINSTEVWTSETVLSTVKQIRFYWDAGFFSSISSVIDVLNDLENAMKIVQKQAETGHKFSSAGNMTSATSKLFVSDVMIGTNSILITAGVFKASFISYSTFNFMQTLNHEFNRQNEQWMNNLISRSTLISTVAEKQRNQFFKGIYKLIDEHRQYVKDSN